jgi:cytochrome c-type biogenesis protein
MDFTNIGVGLAFLAGLASFFSPCVFALVPAYIGYLSGRAAASGEKASSLGTLSHGLAFVLGFSTVFITLGLVASAIGGLLLDLRTWLARIGGIVVIIFGIHMTGLFRIPFLEYDLRAQSAPQRSQGYLASFLMGVFFSAGWAPCVGPILGSILTLAMSGGSISHGLVLLSAYSAGLAIPFLIASVEIGLVTSVLRRYGKAMHYVEVVMGVILIILGIMLLTGQLSRISGLGTGIFGIYDEVVLGRILLILVLALCVLGLIPAFMAYRKGRNFFEWWLFGVGLFPIALIMAYRLPARAGPEEVAP